MRGAAEAQRRRQAVSRIACIDLGSNSFHLVIAGLQNGECRVAARRREVVQLGEGLHISREISSRAFTRGLRSLEHFQILMRQWKVQRCWALGTNAFRTARNAPDFIAAAARAGIRIAVASGEQEALLVYEGVASALPAAQQRRLVVDIGGGSAEIVTGEGLQPGAVFSVPLGCISWRDRFFSADARNRKTLEATLDEAVAAAQAICEPAAPAIRAYGCTEAFASSGTARMLSSVCRENGFGDGGFSLSALQSLRPAMLQAIVEQKELPGLKKKRRELLLPGYAAAVGLMQALSCSAFRFSRCALREGMLDYMHKHCAVGYEWRA